MLNCKSFLTAISLPRKTTASETGITKMRKACKCSVLKMRAVSSEVTCSCVFSFGFLGGGQHPPGSEADAITGRDLTLENLL